MEFSKSYVVSKCFYLLELRCFEKKVGGQAGHEVQRKILSHALCSYHFRFLWESVGYDYVNSHMTQTILASSIWSSFFLVNKFKSNIEEA